jgi:cation:H+ antiporter
MTTTLLLAAVGLALLVAGGGSLVRGASRVALGVGISPLVVGLTVVAYGTSAPEMAVSVGAALQGPSGADLALGNVVGSNIFNVLFILGLSAVVAPLTVSQQLIRFDVPLMIGVSLLLALLALDGRVTRLDGALLFAGVVAYTAFAIRQSRRESKAVEDEYDQHFRRDTPGARAWAVNLGYIAAGLALLVVGSRWLVDGAVAVARTLGVDELVIGLTIVAAGTSLPEVATSVIATVHGERDIAVGNVVGSNIFNVLSVLGLTALVAPAGVGVAASALTFDIPVMIAVAVACLPIFFTGHTIARWEGVLFLGYHVAYTTYLVLHATSHAALAPFGTAMAWFALPLTAVTLVVLVVRTLRGRGRSGG